MIRSFKIGYSYIHIREENGKTSVLNKDKVFTPIKYAAFLTMGTTEDLTLRDYMMMTGLKLKEAVERLDECGVVLLGHDFKVNFFDKESVERFIEATQD